MDLMAAPALQSTGRRRSFTIFVTEGHGEVVIFLIVRCFRFLRSFLIFSKRCGQILGFFLSQRLLAYWHTRRH